MDERTFGLPAGISTQEASRRVAGSKVLGSRGRALGTLAGLAGVIAMGVALGARPTVASAQQVMLPIEVIGVAGTTRQVSVTVPPNTTVKTLWMQVHSLSYADKASVQINGKSWISLNNQTVSVAEPGKSYGGIGGAFNTLKISIPVPAGTIHSGANTLSFRFNRTDNVSIGFRVLAFNLITPNSLPVLPASTFVQENPNTWTPPVTGAANIAAGETLWRTAPLRQSSASNAPGIQARCGDCHAQDGRDLKYFNFSNNSIIERAKFHGLSASQGMQIAAYIRSLKVLNPGRPWNPPYQPGPGLDSKPVQEWAAGAGIDWALDKDLDTLDYIFPDGITEQAVATSGNLNAREVPIAMQLPDWNHWLPRVHPKDAWGSAFTNSNLLKKYNGDGGGDATFNFRAYLKSTGKIRTYPNVTAYIVAQYGLQNDLGYWGGDRRILLNPRKEVANIPWSPAYSEKVYGTALWQLVKMWGLMQEFNLEGMGQQVYGPHAEPRTWFVDFPFMTSPFMLKIPNDANGIGGSGLTNEYFSNAWYHLQLILNDSNRQPNGSWPIDWPYAYGKQKDLYRQSKYPDAMRQVLWLVKGMQETDNGIGPEDFNHGWRPSMAGDISLLVNVAFVPMWSNVPTQTRSQILEAMLRTWFTKTKQYTAQQYYTARIATAAYEPKPRYAGEFGDKMAYMLPKFRAAGVSSALVHDISDWAATVWPLGQWNVNRR